MMLKKYRKQLYISLLIVFLCFASLYIYSYLKRDNQENPISVDFHTSSSLKLKNLLPVSDTLGKSFNGSGTAEGVQAYAEFTVKNKSSEKQSFEIFITESSDKESISKISGNYVKLYLTNAVDTPLSGFEKRKIPTYNDLPVMIKNSNGKLLYRGVLSSYASEKFKLRIWLSDSYSFSNIDNEKEFMVEVNVRGV